MYARGRQEKDKMVKWVTGTVCHNQDGFVLIRDSGTNSQQKGSRGLMFSLSLFNRPIITEHNVGKIQTGPDIVPNINQSLTIVYGTVVVYLLFLIFVLLLLFVTMIAF